MVLELSMLAMFLQFEIKSTFSRCRCRDFLANQTRLLCQCELLRCLRTGWSSRALIWLHCLETLVAWTLWNLSVEDFIQIWLLVQCLCHLLQRLHRWITRLFVHRSLVRTDRTIEVVSNLGLRGTCIFGNILDYLLASIAQTATLMLIILPSSSWLWIESCPIRWDFLADVDAEMVGWLGLELRWGDRLVAGCGLIVLIDGFSTTWISLKLTCLPVWV